MCIFNEQNRYKINHVEYSLYIETVIGSCHNDIATLKTTIMRHLCSFLRGRRVAVRVFPSHLTPNAPRPPGPPIHSGSYYPVPMC